ncbi:hypothetical protein [Streptomyces sp. 5-10]|uniref:aromatic-ring hydroxylase C-terminal domain-containing protein n=1 Tax=Streptomyces sp. 5-10 TaxID=878925 RepID=UPI00168A9970|nr:hypothetical protein [Streptomyces sp. 5-10]MBD3004093.1 hypothetical protein [Streptomyces sp. 5-10]
MRAVTLGPRPARWLRDRLAPAVLGVGRVRDTIAGGFTGVTLRYPRGRRQHALVGTRATEVPLAEGRLTELQRAGGFLLIRQRGASSVDTEVAQAERTDSGPALLVRPDGYVAWAGPGVRTNGAYGTDGPGGWHSTWRAWTGPAAEAVRTGR